MSLSIAVDVNDTVMMTIQEQEVSAVICGIFEDGLEQPVVYMSYTVASRILPKEETIDLLFRLKRTDDLEEAAKEVVGDLKKVYAAVTLDEAEENLRQFGDTWRKQYPSCVKSWEENWEVLSTFFEYPAEIRKIIYTTNIIEGLNRQFRQITKNKPSFTGDDSLRRMLYLASQRIVKHWHARCQNWDLVRSQLEILFADRKAG